MPIDLQAKLLKAIEDHKVRRLGGEKEVNVDVQIVAASNRDLEQMVSNGSFRSDLYHRLSVFRLMLPPLRAAREDLDLFVAEYNAKAGRQVKDIPEEVWTKLKSHHWPGNVMDKFIIKTALERAGYNLTAAARALGATRETLRYRVRKYHLKSIE